MKLADELWNNWFAGFVDGEGCFTVERTKPSWYGPRFAINQRIDNRAVLYAIQRVLGVGKVTFCSNAARRMQGSNSADLAQYRVYGGSSLPIIEALEDRLQTKKVIEFVLWEEAVRLHLSTTKSTKQIRMQEIYAELQDLKKFRASA